MRREESSKATRLYSLASLAIVIFWFLIEPIGTQAQTFDLRGITGPYNFFRFQKLPSGEKISVGGDGDFVYNTTNSGSQFRGRVDGIDLNGVYFVNRKIGWVVGTGGSIYRTVDHGRTWAKQESTVDTELFAISCVGESQCWVGGENGVVLRTKNGLTWERLETGSRVDFLAIDFLDERFGIVVGRESVILRTENAGESWAKQEIFGTGITCNGYAVKTSNADLHAVSIFDRANAWIAGTEGVARYFDFSSRWEYACINEAIAPVGIVTKDGKRIFAIGTFGKNWVSDDSGVTWRPFVWNRDN